MEYIEIKEEVKIPGTDIILEKGDKLLFISEAVNHRIFKIFSDLTQVNVISLVDELISDIIEEKGLFVTEINNDMFKITVNCNISDFIKIEKAIEACKFFKEWID